ALSTTVSSELPRNSFLKCLYGFKEVLPGLLAMLHVAVFSNNLPGVPNPFTLENLFSWLDGLIGPLNHQPFFQVMNTNFVWNPILMGMIIGNVFGVPDSWKRGLSYIHILMPLGIIMLAPHFILGHSFKLGLWPIILCTGFMFLTASGTLFFSRFLKVDDRQASVIAGGLATGDPHACIILMPLIKAKGGQVLNASIGVIGFGLLAMMVLPFLAGLLNFPEKILGLLAVLGIGNGHQALYAAYQSGYEAGRYALWFDVGRQVIMPAGFLYVFIIMLLRKRRALNNPDIMATRGIDRFPLWLTVFIIAWILACLHLFKEPAHHAIFNMVKWDFSLAAAALGLSLSFKDIIAVGIRGWVLTCFMGALRIALLLALLTILVKTGLMPA
ncbi:MAG: putative sulfate exporter family transporter, partial [Desulfobacca sp.]|nr:putative sulfate exporter family transporter [Desulfobacca sp.]